MIFRGPQLMGPSSSVVTKLSPLRQSSQMTNSCGLLLLLLLLLVLPGQQIMTAAAARANSGSSGVLSNSGPSSVDCGKSQKVYVNKGLPMEHVAGRPVPGDHLTVCSATTTCCKKTMEQRLVQQSAQETRNAMMKHVSKRLRQLNSRRNALEAFMMRILDRSYDTLHKMFAKTYGYIYLSHSSIVKEFYSSMKKYLKGEAEDIGKHIDDFFNKLQERMLAMIDRESRTDEHLRKCLLRQLSASNAFGDAPGRIKTGLRRTLVTTRTFIMGMSHMHDLLQRIVGRVQATLSRDCINSLTRLNMCPLCAGVVSRPCTNFCHNVMRGCLYQLYDIIPSWQRLIKEMQKLEERLSGPLSIENSLNSLGVMVSDGIMNFQRTYQELSKDSTRDKCRMSRGKRSVGALPGKFRSREKFGWKYVRIQEFPKMVHQIRNEILQPQMNIWDNLMNMPCKKVRNQCWNGTAVAPYEHQLVSGNLKAQVSNPEVAVDTSLKDPTFAEAKKLMGQLTMSCTRALFNNEVNWIAPSPVSTTFQKGAWPSGQEPSDEGSGFAPSLVANNRDPIPAPIIDFSGDGKPAPRSTNKPMPITRPSSHSRDKPRLPPDDEERMPVNQLKAQPFEGSGDNGGVMPTRRTQGSISGTTKKLSEYNRDRIDAPAPTRRLDISPKRNDPVRPVRPIEGSGSSPEPILEDKNPYERPPPDEEDSVEGSGRSRNRLPERKNEEAFPTYPSEGTSYPNQVWIPSKDNRDPQAGYGVGEPSRRPNIAVGIRGHIHVVLTASVIVLFLELQRRIVG